MHGGTNTGTFQVCPWRFMAMRWKAWAFPKSRNPYQLKKQAALDILLWPGVGFFTKKKPAFEKPDYIVLGQDHEIPKETAIYYSKSKYLNQMAVMLLGIATGLFVILLKDQLYTGLFLMLITSIFAFIEYKEATNMEPQLVLSNTGISTVKTGFKTWKEIQNEKIGVTPGERPKGYLSYDCQEENIRLYIDDFNIDFGQLEVLLKLYRSRYKKKLHTKTPSHQGNNT